MKATRYLAKARPIRLAALVPVALALFGALASAAHSATYDDIALDTSGKTVAVAPEHPWLGTSYDVGSKCVVGTGYGTSYKTIIVRPPSVEALTGFSSQWVYWRAFYVDIYTGNTVAWNNFSAADLAYSHTPAIFGRHDPTDVTLNDYWTATQSLTLYPSDGASFADPIQAHIQVAWYTGTGWVYKSFAVDWMWSPANNYNANRAC